jgi:hypothetical protein
MLVTIFDETPYIFKNLFINDWHCISTTKESDDVFTKCTKAELYEIVFGITDIDGLPDIDYYRGKISYAISADIYISSAKNYPYIFSDDSLCISMDCETKEINDELRQSVIYFIVNGKRVDFDESMIDEKMRKKLLKNGTKFYITKLVKYTGDRLEYYVKTKTINPLCNKYLIKKFISGEMLKYLLNV